MSDPKILLLHPEKINLDNLAMDDLISFLNFRSVAFQADNDLNVLRGLFKEFILPNNQRKYRNNFLGRQMTALQQERCGGGEPCSEKDSTIDFWYDKAGPTNSSPVKNSEDIPEDMEVSSPVNNLKRCRSQSLEASNDDLPENLVQSDDQIDDQQPTKKFCPIVYP